MRLRSRWHPVLQIHSQAVSYPVDVIEVGDDLNGVVDRFVVKSKTAQVVDVLFIYSVRLARQLFSESQQGLCGISNRGSSPVGFDLRCQLFTDLSPEVIPVGLSSVVTVVGFRDYDGEHFPRGSRQR